MFRVFLANYVNLALSFYDLAALANFLDRWFYFHANVMSTPPSMLCVLIFLCLEGGVSLRLFFPVDNPASLFIVRGKLNRDPVAR